ncbi:MAG TPA: GNAT family N-acetyltransferase [Verrucomicrobiae bacterium]|nr:GNAT family N-acetyltransferase [Verrucomicrobiae bacterium]
MGREAAKFFDECSIYEHVLDHNYMFHEEIYRGIERLLADHFAARPFSILDLGCGSARHFSSALAGRAISAYKGYDLSEAPLPEARRNLARLHCPAEFFQGDLLEALRRESAVFDLIFCGFSLHHLTSEGKKEFFRLAHRRLSAGGLLLIVDPARKEDETRPVYLERYCGWIRSDWQSLPQGGIDAICEHICDNDSPESARDLRAMAAEAGFDRARELESFGWHRTWGFEKRSSTAVTIRPARGEDAGPIARLHVESWRTTYAGIIPDDYIARFTADERERVWRRILAEEARRECVCVAEDDAGTLVGFVSGGAERSGAKAFRGELYALYLLQPFQRRGIGRRLTAALARRLLAAGYDSMLVWVLAENPAREFYAVLGGALVGEKPAGIGGAALTEVAYGWKDIQRLLA